jgi:hypothetical protein
MVMVLLQSWITEVPKFPRLLEQDGGRTVVDLKFFKEEDRFQIARRYLLRFELLGTRHVIKIHRLLIIEPGTFLRFMGFS